jgi:hypothetical protein
MVDGEWISYLRVSTDRQGKSGLGIEAQRNAVAEYLNGGNWAMVKEFVEIESGRNTDRPKLAEAIKPAGSMAPSSLLPSWTGFLAMLTSCWAWKRPASISFVPTYRVRFRPQATHRVVYRPVPTERIRVQQIRLGANS